jgi:hypothetical protein
VTHVGAIAVGDSLPAVTGHVIETVAVGRNLMTGDAALNSKLLAKRVD